MASEIYVVASPDASVFHWFRDCPALEAATHEVVVEWMDGIAPSAVTASHGLLPLCRRCEDELAHVEPRDAWAEELPTSGVRTQAAGAPLRAWSGDGRTLTLYADRLEVVTPPAPFGEATVETIPLDAVVEVFTATRRVPLLQDASIEIAHVEDGVELTTRFALAAGDDPDDACAAIGAALAGAPAPAEPEVREIAVERPRFDPTSGRARALSAGEAAGDPGEWALGVQRWTGTARAHDVESDWVVTHDFTGEATFTLARTADGDDADVATWTGPARGVAEGQIDWDDELLEHPRHRVAAHVEGTAWLIVRLSNGAYNLTFDFPALRVERVRGSSAVAFGDTPWLNILGVDGAALPAVAGPIEDGGAWDIPGSAGKRTIEGSWSVLPEGGGGYDPHLPPPSPTPSSHPHFFNPRHRSYRPDLNWGNPAWYFYNNRPHRNMDAWRNIAMSWLRKHVHEGAWPAIRNTYRVLEGRVDLRAEHPQVDDFVRVSFERLIEFNQLED